MTAEALRQHLDEVAAAQALFVPRYASFAPAFVLHELAEHHATRRTAVLDPFAGLGTTLWVAQARGHVTAGVDLNPALVRFARLFDLSFLRWLLREGIDLQRVQGVLGASIPTFEARGEPCDNWLGPRANHQLGALGRLLASDTLILKMMAPARRSTESASNLQTLLWGALVAAARKIAAFTPCRNPTWLKRGGFVRDGAVPDALLSELPRLAAALSRLAALSFGLREGRFRLTCGPFSELESGMPAVVITSPPFANRLDYTRLYGPELAVMAAAGLPAPPRSAYVGTNQVEPNLPTLPASSALHSALAGMLASDRYAARRYYVPYFVQYAESLSNFAGWLGRSRSRAASIQLRDVVTGGIRLRFGRHLADELRRRHFRVIVEETRIEGHIGQARGLQYEHVIRASR